MVVAQSGNGFQYFPRSLAVTRDHVCGKVEEMPVPEHTKNARV